MRRKNPPEIPAVRAEGTYLYLTEDGAWPDKPHVILSRALHWLQEGMLLELEDLRPGTGAMGSLLRVRVLEVRPRVRVFPGWYGQVVVHALVEPALSPEEAEEALRLRLEEA